MGERPETYTADGDCTQRDYGKESQDGSTLVIKGIDANGHKHFAIINPLYLLDVSLNQARTSSGYLERDDP